VTTSADASRPVRVLHLRDSPWVDGPGRTILESGSHFAPDRVDYHVGIFVGANPDAHPMIVAARERLIAVHAILDSGGFSWNIVDAIVDLLDRYDIHVLHTSDLRSNVYGLLARRRRRTLAIVCTAHGWIANTARRRFTRLVDKILLRFFDRVIFVSHATRALVPRWWLPERRSTVLHNALALDAYGSGKVYPPRSVPDPSRRVIMLNVGRLSPEKGQDLFLRAVSQLRDEFPGIHVRFAGIGPLEGELRALALALGLQERVEFLGYVSDMPSAYADADVVVQSSLTEGLPNVILEAAFLEVPVVATNVGGTSEVIEHGRGGWLIEPGSVQALVEGMRRYLKNPGSAVGMTGAARKQVIDAFSIISRTQKMTDIYAQLAWSHTLHTDSRR
jgi:glycosyltransferase involved in cell wall biosynthesis